MNRIQTAFAKGKAFIGFVTAGDPSLEKTEEFILKMLEAGCDLVEIGIPFSDPIAEGPVIQEADLRSLAGGTTTDGVFEMTARVRKQTDAPLVFMTYYNPVFSYGNERFFKRCQEVGADGIIIPDVPFEEKQEVVQAASKYGIAVISMIAPTSHDRIRKIAAEAQGFLYVVSSMGVTGVRKEIETDLGAILQVVRESTQVPAAVGFGVSTPEQAAQIGKITDGVIVGSAIVKLIAKFGENAAEPIFQYVQSMKDALRKL